MTLSIEKRVARGAAWLDEAAPGWETRIDVATLDIADGDRCICGQLALWAQMLEPRLAMECGFLWANPPIDEDAAGYSALIALDCAALHNAWVTLIKDRLDQGIVL